MGLLADAMSGPYLQQEEGNTYGNIMALRASARHPAAEQRIAALLAALQPNPTSEARRLAIAHYICSIIRGCFQDEFQVEAFMFGSVPLRTYLPDGDVDISLFCKSRRDYAVMRGAWASRLVSALEWETRRGPLHLPIQDVQIIQAEVQLVKCIVAGVVVDISFETSGGLCTVAFLESLDRLVGRGHLFKRSIILIKAWCYYESRLLGAHHGLLSSYALEAMVLNVINLHHAILRTPFQVLMQFLETYSTFDWTCHGLSLQGTVNLDSLPAFEVLSPPMSQPEPLITSVALSQILARYAVPIAQPPPPFPRRHINIFDPLSPGNNLGRSVSKASAARISNALRLGLSSLRQALERSPAGAIESIDGFFRNAWQAPMRAAAEAARYFQGLAAMSAAAKWTEVMGVSPRAIVAPPPPPPPPPRPQQAPLFVNSPNGSPGSVSPSSESKQQGTMLPEGALPASLAARPAWVQQRAQRSFQATAPWSPQPRTGGLGVDVLKADLSTLEANLDVVCRPQRADRAGNEHPYASSDSNTVTAVAMDVVSPERIMSPGRMGVAISGSYERSMPSPPPSARGRRRAPTILSPGGLIAPVRHRSLGNYAGGKEQERHVTEEGLDLEHEVGGRSSSLESASGDGVLPMEPSSGESVTRQKQGAAADLQAQQDPSSVEPARGEDLPSTGTTSGPGANQQTMSVSSPTNRNDESEQQEDPVSQEDKQEHCTAVPQPSAQSWSSIAVRGHFRAQHRQKQQQPHGGGRPNQQNQHNHRGALLPNFQASLPPMQER